MVWIFAALVLWGALAWLGRRLLRPRPESAADTTGGLADGGGPDPSYDIEIGDELDLHGVPPREVAELVDAFVDEAVRRGLPSIRIVHGKGIGVLRRLVRARLARHPAVARYGDADDATSSWGATVAWLLGGDRRCAPPPNGLGWRRTRRAEEHRA